MKIFTSTFLLSLFAITSWTQLIEHIDTVLTTSKAENIMALNNGSFLISGIHSDILSDLDPDKTYTPSLEIITEQRENVVTKRPGQFNHILPVHQRGNSRIVCTARDTIQNIYRFITFDQNLGDMVLNKKLSFDSLLIINQVLSAGIKGGQIEVIADCNYMNADENLVLYYDISTLELMRKKRFPNFDGSKSLFNGSISVSANTITKYDDSLNVTWTKTLIDEYNFRDVVINSFGEIFVCGEQGAHAIVVKLDAAGNWLAQKQISRIDPDADPDVRMTDLYLSTDEKIIAVGADYSFNPMTTQFAFKETHPIVGFYERDMSVINSGHIDKKVFINDITYVNDKLMAVLEENGNEWCCESHFIEIQERTQTSVAQSDKLQTIRMFPNPTSGVLNIPSGENYAIEISNMQGQKVHQAQGVNTINLMHLEAGIYIIQITDGRKRNAQKFIKI